MLFSECFYFLQENFNVMIEEKHKIIDVPFLPLRQKTGNAPMSETNVFNYDNRFDIGFCSRANTRFDPTFVLGRNNILGY